MDMEIKLSAEEIKEAVNLYLKQKHNMTASEVNVVVGQISVGYGPYESTTPGFKHVLCKIKGE